MSVTKVQLVSDGAVIGIQSAGTPIGTGATTLNFIGAGNTFAYNSGTKTLDISIQGGGGSTTSTVGSGGSGGGGAAGAFNLSGAATTPATDGRVNTGGGGGGGDRAGTPAGFGTNGGSGIVLIAYPS